MANLPFNLDRDILGDALIGDLENAFRDENFDAALTIVQNRYNELVDAAAAGEPVETIIPQIETLSVLGQEIAKINIIGLDSYNTINGLSFDENWSELESFTTQLLQKGSLTGDASAYIESINKNANLQDLVANENWNGLLETTSNALVDPSLDDGERTYILTLNRLATDHVTLAEHDGAVSILGSGDEAAIEDYIDQRYEASLGNDTFSGQMWTRMHFHGQIDMEQQYNPDFYDNLYNTEILDTQLANATAEFDALLAAGDYEAAQAVITNTIENIEDIRENPQLVHYSYKFLEQTITSYSENIETREANGELSEYVEEPSTLLGGFITLDRGELNPERVFLNDAAGTGLSKLMSLRSNETSSLATMDIDPLIATRVSRAEALMGVAGHDFEYDVSATEASQIPLLENQYWLRHSAYSMLVGAAYFGEDDLLDNYTTEEITSLLNGEIPASLASDEARLQTLSDRGQEDLRVSPERYMRMEILMSEARANDSGYNQAPESITETEMAANGDWLRSAMTIAIYERDDIVDTFTDAEIEAILRGEVPEALANEGPQGTTWTDRHGNERSNAGQTRLESLADFGLDRIGQDQYNLSETLGWATRMNTDSPVVQALLHGREMYQGLPNFTAEGTGRFIKGLATDPFSYVGLGVFAKGFQGARLTPYVIGAAEGVLYGVADDQARQTTELVGGHIQERDFQRTAVAGAFGGAFGVGFAGVFDLGPRAPAFIRKNILGRTADDTTPAINDIAETLTPMTLADEAADLAPSQIVTDAPTAPSAPAAAQDAPIITATVDAPTARLDTPNAPDAPEAPTRLDAPETAPVTPRINTEAPIAPSAPAAAQNSPIITPTVDAPAARLDTPNAPDAPEAPTRLDAPETAPVTPRINTDAPTAPSAPAAAQDAPVITPTLDAPSARLETPEAPHAPDAPETPSAPSADVVQFTPPSTDAPVLVNPLGAIPGQRSPFDLPSFNDRLAADWRSVEGLNARPSPLRAPADTGGGGAGPARPNIDTAAPTAPAATTAPTAPVAPTATPSYRMPPRWKDMGAEELAGTINRETDTGRIAYILGKVQDVRGDVFDDVFAGMRTSKQEAYIVHLFDSDPAAARSIMIDLPEAQQTRLNTAIEGARRLEENIGGTTPPTRTQTPRLEEPAPRAEGPDLRTEEATPRAEEPTTPRDAEESTARPEIADDLAEQIRAAGLDPNMAKGEHIAIEMLDEVIYPKFNNFTQNADGSLLVVVDGPSGATRKIHVNESIRTVRPDEADKVNTYWAKSGDAASIGKDYSDVQATLWDRISSVRNWFRSSDKIRDIKVDRIRTADEAAEAVKNRKTDPEADLFADSRDLGGENKAVSQWFQRKESYETTRKAELADDITAFKNKPKSEQVKFLREMLDKKLNEVEPSRRQGLWRDLLENPENVLDDMRIVAYSIKDDKTARALLKAAYEPYYKNGEIPFKKKWNEGGDGVLQTGQVLTVAQRIDDIQGNHGYGTWKNQHDIRSVYDRILNVGDAIKNATDDTGKEKAQKGAAMALKEFMDARGSSAVELVRLSIFLRINLQRVYMLEAMNPTRQSGVGINAANQLHLNEIAAQIFNNQGVSKEAADAAVFSYYLPDRARRIFTQPLSPEGQLAAIRAVQWPLGITPRAAGGTGYPSITTAAKRFFIDAPSLGLFKVAGMLDTWYIRNSVRAAGAAMLLSTGTAVVDHAIDGEYDTVFSYPGIPAATFINEIGLPFLTDVPDTLSYNIGTLGYEAAQGLTGFGDGTFDYTIDPNGFDRFSSDFITDPDFRADVLGSKDGPVDDRPPVPPAAGFTTSQAAPSATDGAAPPPPPPVTTSGAGDADPAATTGGDAGTDVADAGTGTGAADNNDTPSVDTTAADRQAAERRRLAAARRRDGNGYSTEEVIQAVAPGAAGELLTSATSRIELGRVWDTAKGWLGDAGVIAGNLWNAMGQMQGPWGGIAQIGTAIVGAMMGKNLITGIWNLFTTGSNWKSFALTGGLAIGALHAFNYFSGEANNSTTTITNSDYRNANRGLGTESIQNYGGVGAAYDSTTGDIQMDANYVAPTAGDTRTAQLGQDPATEQTFADAQNVLRGQMAPSTLARHSFNEAAHGIDTRQVAALDIPAGDIAVTDSMRASGHDGVPYVLASVSSIDIATGTPAQSWTALGELANAGAEIAVEENFGYVAGQQGLGVQNAAAMVGSTFAVAALDEDEKLTEARYLPAALSGNNDVVFDMTAHLGALDATGWREETAKGTGSLTPDADIAARAPISFAALAAEPESAPV